jgi:ATP-dependent helicase/nuclease subunit B
VDGRKHAPAAIISALQASLQQLGLDTGFSLDAAGQRILEELEQMQAASRDNSLQMDWQEFRTWLGRTLERFNFQPPAQAGQVQLMGLAQSATMHFDALIIAGAEREHLPGSGGNSPFFNDGVRQALGLSSRTQRLAQKFYQFRTLLGSAPAILITRRREQDGEDIVATPWLEQLQSFHRLAYGDDLLDQQLMTLVDQSGTQVSAADAPLPGLTPANPSVVVDASLLPEHYSASSYQQLINCPYQFFAARCLKLEPPESIREMLEKSDYGERVHRCLEAFHSDVPGLPGPFSGQLDKQNLSAAEHCLHEITDAVFARDLEDNFLHRGWVKRWRDIIPHYLLWQLERQTAWTVRETEVQVDTPLAGSNIALRGRLDRLDGSAEGIGVLDYKTGAIAHADDVQSGEAVQLPFYALLAEQGLGLEVGSVEYVALDKGLASSKGQLQGESLHELKQENGKRLAQLSDAMRGSSALPAWGDEITCSYCHMSGICRREAWQEN